MWGGTLSRRGRNPVKGFRGRLPARRDFLGDRARVVDGWGKGFLQVCFVDCELGISFHGGGTRGFG